MNECEEGLRSSSLYRLGVQTGTIESSGLLQSCSTQAAVWFWQTSQEKVTQCANVIYSPIQEWSWLVVCIGAVWLQTPTQNLPEEEQQCRFSVQNFLLCKSSVSLFNLCSPQWPCDLFLLVLWTSYDVLTSLSPPNVWWKSVRAACGQEVITGPREGIGRHGQTGRGPLTGWGQTWSLYREKREKSYTKSQILCHIFVSLHFSGGLPLSAW